MTPLLPPLPCPTCGVLDVPRISPGTGPHVAKAVCGHCAKFIKWLPRVFIEQLTGKESQGMGGVNRVILFGAIGKYGVTVSYANSGTPCASFMLVVTEQGQDGKEHATLI